MLISQIPFENRNDLTPEPVFEHLKDSNQMCLIDCPMSLDCHSKVGC